MASKDEAAENQLLKSFCDLTPAEEQAVKDSLKWQGKTPAATKALMLSFLASASSAAIAGSADLVQDHHTFGAHTFDDIIEQTGWSEGSVIASIANTSDQGVVVQFGTANGDFAYRVPAGSGLSTKRLDIAGTTNFDYSTTFDSSPVGSGEVTVNLERFD